MSKQFTPDAHKLLNLIRDCNLADISFDQSKMSLRLVFSFADFEGGEHQDVILVFNDILDLNISPPSDQYNHFLVGDASLTIVEEENENMPAGAEYPLFCFNVEGYIDIRVVAKDVQMFQELKLV